MYACYLGNLRTTAHHSASYCNFSAALMARCLRNRADGVSVGSSSAVARVAVTFSGGCCVSAAASPCGDWTIAFDCAFPGFSWLQSPLPASTRVVLTRSRMADRGLPNCAERVSVELFAAFSTCVYHVSSSPPLSPSSSVSVVSPPASSPAAPSRACSAAEESSAGPFQTRVHGD